MVKFRPSRALAEAFYKDNSRAVIIGDVVEIESVIDELDVGMIVAFRHDARAAGSHRFWLGKVMEIDHDMEEVKLHYYGTENQRNDGTEKYKLVWTDRTDNARPAFSRIGENCPSRAYDPWTVIVDMTSIVRAGLQFRRDQTLNAESREVLDGWKPMVMANRGFI